jgi:hypothetical protein
MTDFDFSTPMVRSGCRILVVFGIGDGAVIGAAADFPFDHIYGIEASHHQAIVTAFKHAENQKITLIHGKGARGWGQVSDEIPAETPVLFLFGGATAESDRAAVSAVRDMSRDVVSVRD